MNENRLEGDVTLTFIMGGISKEKKKPYLKVSNGVKEIFVTIPKGVTISEGQFADYEEGDQIKLRVRQLVGGETVTLVDFN